MQELCLNTVGVFKIVFLIRDKVTTPRTWPNIRCYSGNSVLWTHFYWYQRRLYDAEWVCWSTEFNAVNIFGRFYVHVSLQRTEEYLDAQQQADINLMFNTHTTFSLHWFVHHRPATVQAWTRWAHGHSCEDIQTPSLYYRSFYGFKQKTKWVHVAIIYDSGV